MSHQYTPGQWRIGDAGTSIFGPKQTDGSLAETIATNIRKPGNALLMAAAPDLLTALKAVTEYAERYADLSVDPGDGDCAKSCAAAHAAIAKAGA